MVYMSFFGTNEVNAVPLFVIGWLLLLSIPVAIWFVKWLKGK